MINNMEDIVTKYEDKIVKEMIDCYRRVLEYNGNIEYKIYIWEDGEIEILETLNGSRGWLQPKECEPRKLYYITTVKSPGFDPFDCIAECIPEDEDEQEKLREEIIDDEVACYRQDVHYTLYDAITDEGTDD